MTDSSERMDPFGSQPITEWLRGCHNGEELAQHKLWQAVSEIIIGYCQRRPGRRTIDGADGIANEAFFQLLMGLQENRCKKLADRHDLLDILFHLCKCRTIDSQRRGDTKKRGEGKQTDLDLNNQPSEDALKSMIGESFEELLELVAKRYASRPEIRIFEHAYLCDYKDQDLALKLKDEQGKDMCARQIQRRRQAMIEWLKNKVSRRE